MSQILQHRQQHHYWSEHICNDKQNHVIKLNTKYQWIPYCNRNLFIKCAPQITPITTHKMNIFIKFYFDSKDFKRWQTIPLLSTVSTVCHVTWTDSDKSYNINSVLKIKRNNCKIQFEQIIHVGTIQHQSKRIIVNINLEPPEFVYHHL